MTKRPKRFCRWCHKPLVSKDRKYCNNECRIQAQENGRWAPSPQEIRAVCRQIQEEGGEEWKRNRSCYPPQPVSLSVCRVNLDISD